MLLLLFKYDEANILKDDALKRWIVCTTDPKNGGHTMPGGHTGSTSVAQKAEGTGKNITFVSEGRNRGSQ